MRQVDGGPDSFGPSSRARPCPQVAAVVEHTRETVLDVSTVRAEILYRLGHVDHCQTIVGDRSAWSANQWTAADRSLLFVRFGHRRRSHHDAAVDESGAGTASRKHPAGVRRRVGTGHVVRIGPVDRVEIGLRGVPPNAVVLVGAVRVRRESLVSGARIRSCGLWQGGGGPVEGPDLGGLAGGQPDEPPLVGRGVVNGHVGVCWGTSAWSQ